MLIIVIFSSQFILFIVLLYRCQSAHITHIWGCNDNEKLTEVKNLDSILSSKLWMNIKQLIMIDIPDIHSSYLNFHDYDNIEIWGI